LHFTRLTPRGYRRFLGVAADFAFVCARARARAAGNASFRSFAQLCAVQFNFVVVVPVPFEPCRINRFRGHLESYFPANLPTPGVPSRPPCASSLVAGEDLHNASSFFAAAIRAADEYITFAKIRFQANAGLTELRVRQVGGWRRGRGGGWELAGWLAGWLRKHCKNSEMAARRDCGRIPGVFVPFENKMPSFSLSLSLLLSSLLFASPPPPNPVENRVLRRVTSVTRE